MTPQELKNSILQLAIQGKLVEQRPEEGTGEELYQQIQKEKQALIKAGKIKKGKPLPEITEDEVPFEIPESWKWVRIGETFSLQAGKNVTSSDIFSTPSYEQKYLCYGGNGIRGYVATYNREGSFPIIGRQGALCGNINLANGQFYATEHAVVVEAFANTNVLLCAQFLRALNLNQYATATAQPGLSVAKINQVLFPLPPLAEQKRIVAKIEELLSLIDRYEQAWTRLENFNKRFPVDMQKSILQMAIQGKLVEQRPEEGTGEDLYQQIQREKQALIKAGKLKKQKPLPEIAEDEVPFEIPETWKWVRLGMVAFVLGGKRVPAGRQLTHENTGHVYIRISDMKNSSVDMNHLMYVPDDIFRTISQYIIKKEDLYITVAGTIGRVGIIPASLDGANLTENADRLVFKQLNKVWLLQFLNSPAVQMQIAESTTKVGQPKLAIKRIENLMIPLPPLAEQKRIVARLEELLPLCEGLK